MEFWEGAVLIAGGIWLVGRMHRRQTMSFPSGGGYTTFVNRVAGPTSATNTDGSNSLVAGETLSSGSLPMLNAPKPCCGTGTPWSRPTSGVQRSGIMQL